MNTTVNYRINEEMLRDVNAGTFTGNTFPQCIYEHAGFKCSYHFFDKDEFFLDGKLYHHDEANAIMAKLGYTKELIKPSKGGMGESGSTTRMILYKLNGKEIMREVAKS